jgi:hypothetical protein
VSGPITPGLDHQPTGERLVNSAREIPVSRADVIQSRPMRRPLFVPTGLLLLTMVVAACGAEPSPIAIGEPVAAAPAPSSGPAAPPGSGVTTAVPAESQGPIAPDFTLTLGDGGTYTLSEGEKPVYMVFWAEW